MARQRKLTNSASQVQDSVVVRVFDSQTKGPLPTVYLFASLNKRPDPEDNNVSIGLLMGEVCCEKNVCVLSLSPLKAILVHLQYG